MKTTKYLAAVLTVAALAAFRPAEAQIIPDTYINVDWQLNVPVGSSFADKTTGWGMNFEGGYFVTPEFSVGPFISYHTNFENIPRQTLQLKPGTAMTTNQKHSLFQLPFGVTTRYTFMKDRVFEPYVGVKLGANYAEMASYYSIFKHYDDTWGFYVQPEIGVSIFPWTSQRYGFHVALYYGYSTNSGSLLIYSMDSINSFGLRVGVSF